MVELIIDPSVEGRLDTDERARLERRLARMLEAAGKTEEIEADLEMSVRLTDDDTIWVLNRDYRHKDRPTDVLAFSQREGDDPGAALHPELLGDVVISMDTAARQAKETLFAEVLFLCTHGLCHLLGYDHRDDEEEAAMNARMKALMDEAERRGPTRAA
jgi:probable rRNA maturation factor